MIDRLQEAVWKLGFIPRGPSVGSRRFSEIYRNLAAAIPPGTEPDPESGQAILDRYVLTLGQADNLPSGETLDQPFQGVNPETRLDSFQLAGALWKRGANNMILATRA
jgi:hypothetical protein